MNDSYSILIIEDEKNILDFMSRTLKANGYKTTTVTSGKAGLSIINSQCPDLILLDLGLPDMDGNDIIASVREWTSCPIIVISARTGEHDKVAALDLGADDYITKPFGTSELLARIRTSLRHSNRMASNSPLYIRPYKCQGLILDFEKRMLTLDGIHHSHSFYLPKSVSVIVCAKMRMKCNLLLYLPGTLLYIRLLRMC